MNGIADVSYSFSWALSHTSHSLAETFSHRYLWLQMIFGVHFHGKKVFVKVDEE